MSIDERYKQVVKAWKLASVTLEADRARRIREEDVAGAIADFDGFSELDLKARPPRTSSGLVDQQAWFRRMRR